MENLDRIYGVHAVLEALQAHRVKELYLQVGLRGKNLDKILAAAKTQQLPISWQSKAELSLFTNSGVHQGFAARVAPFTYLGLDELLSDLTEREEATLVLLDGLTDPHNFGAIARTAEATGAVALILPKHRSVGLTPAAMKASAGALEHLSVVQVTNLAQTVDKLKAAGFWIFATDIDGVSYEEWDTKGKVALIIGSEGKGVGRNLKKLADQSVSLPMIGHVQSLNASVAAGVLLYKILENKLKGNENS